MKSTSKDEVTGERDADHQCEIGVLLPIGRKEENVGNAKVSWGFPITLMCCDKISKILYQPNSGRTSKCFTNKCWGHHAGKEPRPAVRLAKGQVRMK